MMKFGLILLTIAALPCPALRAETSLPPDALMLAHWIEAQQFADSHSPSYGALRIEPGAAITSDKGSYCRVSPYFANLAVLSLSRAKAPNSSDTARRWIQWYLAHLNPKAAPDGVPYEHFYHLDGSGETTCAKSGDHAFCDYNDATDSAAATFFSVLWAATSEGSSNPIVLSTEQQKLVEQLAKTVLELQQRDGLCWAKQTYRVKYLEDNCEVFAGLRDLASLEREVFHDAKHATLYQHAAEHVRTGITNELYDPRSQLFRIAKFENATPAAVDLNTWYPDTQAQFWPILFGVVDDTDPRARAVVTAIDARWNGSTKPDWAAHPEEINGGWIESGSAYGALLAGDSERVHTYVESVKRLKFQMPSMRGVAGFKSPFNVADAGWLLQILASQRTNGL